MKSGPGGIRGAAPIPYQTGREMLGADEVSDAGHGLDGFAKAAVYPHRQRRPIEAGSPQELDLRMSRLL